MVGVGAPGGRDDGQREGDGGAQQKERVKHGEHDQNVTKRSLNYKEERINTNIALNMGIFQYCIIHIWSLLSIPPHGTFNVVAHLSQEDIFTLNKVF